MLSAYNEAKNISRVIAGVRQHAPFADILVVDDGSPDDTAELAREAGVRVVSHPINLGAGAALQTGCRYAAAKHYDYLVRMDGDGQHEPACIADLLVEVRSGNADLASGSRFLGQKSYKAPLSRRFGMILFGALASWATRQRISDPTSGFQALSGRLVRFYASDVFPVDFPDADVLIMVRRAGFRIKEVPVVMYTSSGKSMHSGLRPLYYMFKMSLSIFVTLLRRDKPR